MTDSSVLIANERYKALGSALFRIGSVSLVGVVATVYVDGEVGLFSMGWLIVSAVPFIVGWNVLGLLEKDS